MPRGELPNGSVPVTDGALFANVPDPTTGTDVALLNIDGAVVRVSVPAERWAEPWRGIHGLEPLDGRPGILLVGAAAIAVVDDEGKVSSTPIPDGYVALASTPDPTRFLLATLDDANLPGGLTESTPFAAYLWKVGSTGNPLVLRQHLVEVRPSSVGLAWLRADDGSWWSLTNSAVVERRTNPTQPSSAISPDGTTLVVLAYSVSGCAQETTDRCQVRVVSPSGSVRPLDGPALGIAFDGPNAAVALAARPSLGLPARVAFGPGDQLVIATVK